MHQASELVKDKREYRKEIDKVTESFPGFIKPGTKGVPARPYHVATGIFLECMRATRTHAKSPRVKQKKTTLKSGFLSFRQGQWSVQFWKPLGSWIPPEPDPCFQQGLVPSFNCKLRNEMV
ncbi:uncharacterized protein BKA55DRAFT_566258 [Fusarium redolens]|uniref:Uncharacterized protein n=1 Tax=Fusarium redolens TaxID=48865 RepID=A0A9P9KIH4_FUSRE|nr:uncharacterized protein BKA55DRAFT_566258 [Fusarium redolens]KAH7253784.1 hypothetical protein BKA55DRAFT_566258 [Fusarium redolens]